MFSVILVAKAFIEHKNMRLKYLTILVFSIVQTCSYAYEAYPDCLETSEGCAPDSPTTDLPADSWSESFCVEPRQTHIIVWTVVIHTPQFWLQKRFSM